MLMNPTLSIITSIKVCGRAASGVVFDHPLCAHHLVGVWEALAGLNRERGLELNQHGRGGLHSELSAYRVGFGWLLLLLLIIMIESPTHENIY